MPTLDLMTLLQVDSVTFMPQWRQELSRQAGGKPRVADLGPEVWMAKIGCGQMDNGRAKQAAALINKMRGSLGTFYVWDPRAQYPQADADGSILGASTVTIYALGDDSKSLRLEGLPVGYTLTAGDKLSWDQGTDPDIHRCLHEFSDTVVADGNGRTAMVEVSPHIRPGASTGLTVTLIRPSAEMMIVPGSYDFPSNGSLFSGITFTAVQVP